MEVRKIPLVHINDLPVEIQHDIGEMGWHYNYDEYYDISYQDDYFVLETSKTYFSRKEKYELLKNFLIEHNLQKEKLITIELKGN